MPSTWRRFGLRDLLDGTAFLSNGDSPEYVVRQAVAFASAFCSETRQKD